MHRRPSSLVALVALVGSVSSCAVTVGGRGGVVAYAPPASQAAAPAPGPTTPLPQRGTSCGYACTVDVSHGTSNCQAPVSLVGFGIGTGRASVDMGRFRQLEASVTLSSTAGWSFDIGDSPSDDGFGGDGGDTSNDAELYALDGHLQAFGSDYGPSGAQKKVLDVPFGVGTHTLVLEDQCIRDAADRVGLCAPYLLRLSPPADKEGRPDRSWTMSFDGVPSGRSDRVGHGLDRVELCLR